MARRKKRNDKAEAPPAAPQGDARTSLRDLLKGVSVEAPTKPSPAPPPKKKAPKAAPPAESAAAPGKPSETLRGDDRIAYYNAYSGVKPLGAGEARPRGARRVPPPVEAPPPRSTVDDEARARLAALVAGGVRFDIERDGDEIRGLRVGTSPAVLRALLRLDASPEATLDLHGMRGDEAEVEVARFVREQQRRGARRVCVVHGKGTHSPGKLGVLRDHVVHALVEGGAAPFVQAFATASLAYGGTGALIVELTRRA